MKKVFFLLILFINSHYAKSQTPASIIAELIVLNNQVKNDNCINKKGLIVTNKALNNFFANKIASYLSETGDLSLYKNYATLNSSDGVLNISSNVSAKPGEDGRIKSLTTVGVKANIADGFDACLMAMVETGYAFRNIAGILVASEELEPGTGWQYDDWLKKLANNPPADPKTLSKILVDSYKKRYIQGKGIYKPDPTTTLSALHLTQMNNIAVELDKLSGVLIEKLNDQLLTISASRNECSIYAPDEDDKFYHIDLAHFLDVLSKTNKDKQIVNQAKITQQTVLKAMISNYRGRERAGSFGSYGLAIYFPPNEKSYKEDGYATGGYEKDNKVYPVEFVQNYRWADFLHAYFKVVP